MFIFLINQRIVGLKDFKTGCFLFSQLHAGSYWSYPQWIWISQPPLLIYNVSLCWQEILLDLTPLPFLHQEKPTFWRKSSWFLWKFTSLLWRNNAFFFPNLSACPTDITAQPSTLWVTSGLSIGFLTLVFGYPVYSNQSWICLYFFLSWHCPHLSAASPSPETERSHPVPWNGQPLLSSPIHWHMSRHTSK